LILSKITYNRISTPFRRDKGRLTTVGRTLVAMDSARHMLSEIACGKHHTIKVASLQFAAEELAKDAVMSGIARLPRGEFTKTDSLDDVLKRVQEWDCADVKVESDEEGDTGEVNGEVVKRLAKRLLVTISSAEVARLRKELPTDIIVTEVERHSALFEANSFIALCKAFEATRTKSSELGSLGNAVRNEVSLLDPCKDPQDCIAVLGEIRRYLSDADRLLESVSLPVLTEVDRRAILARTTDGSVIGVKLSELDRMSLMNNPKSEAKPFDESMTYLESVFHHEANTIDLRPRTAKTGTMVGNATARKSRELRESHTRGGAPRGNISTRPPAEKKKGAKANTTDFIQWVKSHPGECFKCGEPGHLKRDCPEKGKESKGKPALPGGGAYVCLPAAYRALPTNLANVILDTGAAASSYVSQSEGFDKRTIHDCDAIINGIGDGAAAGSYGGTVYARTNATVYLPNGAKVERKEVIRFDAIFAPKLVKGGTGLLSHAGFVHDGGINAIVRKSTPAKKSDSITAPQDMILQVGAVGALQDRTKRVEVLLTARDGLLWAPKFEFLSQEEIEALVPNPPASLVHFNEVTK